MEVRVGNVETASGGRQVFGAVAKADTDISMLIRFCHPSRQGRLAGGTPGELLSDPGGERCDVMHRV